MQASPNGEEVGDFGPGRGRKRDAGHSARPVENSGGRAVVLLCVEPVQSDRITGRHRTVVVAGLHGHLKPDFKVAGSIGLLR